MWCAHSRLSNANLELALPNLECLCPVTESDGKAGSGLNGKTLSTYRRFIRNTWPLRNVVNICDVCDQCKSLPCKHELNYLTAETYLKSPLPKVQMLQVTHPCDLWWWGGYCLWTLKGVKGCFPNAIYVKQKYVLVAFCVSMFWVIPFWGHQVLSYSIPLPEALGNYWRCSLEQCFNQA